MVLLQQIKASNSAFVLFVRYDTIVFPYISIKLESIKI